METQMVQKTKKTTADILLNVDRTIDLLNNLQAQLKFAGKQKNNSSERIGEHLNDFCRRLKGDILENCQNIFKEQSAEMQKYLKPVEKKFKSEVALDDLEAFNDDAENSAPKVETGDDGLTAAARNALNTAIAEFLLRRGNCAVAESFCAEAAVQHSAELRENFALLNRILAQLRAESTQAALQWAMNTPAVSQSLVFHLQAFEFVVRVKNGCDAAELVAYAQRTFSAHFATHAEDIRKLMGSVLWRGNIESSPYRSLFDFAAALRAVEKQFAAEFCLCNGLPPACPLEVALNAGAIAIPKLTKISALIREKKIEWSQKGELPVEIELPDFLRNFHSVFTCPVLKIQSTADNPPMCLPCGHIICRDALLKLSKGHQNTRFKCPYCPFECVSTAAMQVYF